MSYVTKNKKTYFTFNIAMCIFVTFILMYLNPYPNFIDML